MSQNENSDDLVDLLNIFTGRYYEFKNFIRERCADDSERLNWEERLNQLIDLSRVVGIFSEENQEKTAQFNRKLNYNKGKEDADDPFL